MPENPVDWIDLTALEIIMPRLHPNFDGFRLVQISDIHFGTWVNRKRLDQAIQVVNDQQPDAVAVTGDFVSRRPERYAPPLVAALQSLLPRQVSVAVMGNHDHWSDPLVVQQIIERAGLVHLANRVHTLHRGEAKLHLAGVDCTYENKDRLDLVLAALPDEGAAILLAHEPDYADISAGTGRFDLQISGHSHGGQVILPLLGPPVLPPHARKYPLGRYQINGMVQYTNRGLGTAHFRLRINCPPEITVFTLRAESGPDPVA